MPVDAHGCPACPHPAIGPGIAGSPDVKVNGRPALRVDDPGIHTACCGPNTWTATQGSMTVFINGKGSHRLTDANRHCGGMGQLVEGSSNVIVGEDAGASGGGSGGAAGSGGAGSGGGGGTAGGGSGGGNAGSSGGAGSNPGHSDKPVEPDQIEVHLVDSTGAAIQRAVRYQLTLPDGSTRAGQTDTSGVLRIDGLTQRGDCTLSLPEEDA